jgi:hypothetical protein
VVAVAVYSNGVLAALFMVYIYAGLILTIVKSITGQINRDNRLIRVTNAMWRWCKWPSLVYVIAAPVLDVLSGVGDHHWWTPFLYVWNGWIWWAYRNAGDDDEWKRKAKRLAEKVKQVGTKLVVVPQGA